MMFSLNLNVHVARQADGSISHLDHLQQPFMAAPSPELKAQADAAGAPSSPAASAEDLANDYLREVAPIYGFPIEMVPGGAGTAKLAGEPEVENRLQAKQSIEMQGTTTVNYQQVHRQIPVWRAGTTVTIQPEPMRVTASDSTVQPDLKLSGLIMGDYEKVDAETMKKLLELPTNAPLQLADAGPSQLHYVYRYEGAQRVDPAVNNPDEGSLQSKSPSLPLPPLSPVISEGGYYVVTEVLFKYPSAELADLNWVAFVEVASGAILFLRDRAPCASGLIFECDPFTSGTPAAVPTAPAATLNPLRKRVTLAGINATFPGQLRGNFVQIVDIEAPSATPPVVPDPPADFDFDALTREFAAVNAYHHCDELFRRMEDMGFNVTSYFDGTTFPVRVDACAFGDQRNAMAPGNATGTGSDGFRFGLASLTKPCTSIAADVRIALHEFGHALLWDSIHWPNFGFAHSAGDALAAILLDPESSLRSDPAKRFDTFPWVLPNRRHDRPVADGWGWDGTRYTPFQGADSAGYIAEQILSTTLFRFYQAIGGDSTNVATRTLAARRAVYLIFRAIGSLGSSTATPTTRPESFATALMNADIGTSDFEGYKGGTLQKVIRWAFEKQGLYQAPGTPRPITKPGAPPPVDVFIDDGRTGEYDFAPPGQVDFWHRGTPTPGTGPADHEPPLADTPGFLFVRVRNRGAQPAQNVEVRVFSADSASPQSWPADFTAVGGGALAVADIPGGGSVIAGPFSWTPHFAGGDTILAAAGAAGDLSNLDPRTFFSCATGPVPATELVSHDNNLALRSF